MIDKATVRRIIDAADIVEVVGDYVHLTKRGANYMGLCPFHNEKTPSFSVNRQRNICKCFSCGKGGSPVNFIMEKEGVNYHDALLQLAKKYGIKVEEREMSDEERQRQSERESMLVVNDWAMQQMQNNLTETDEGKNVGLEYFYQRGITQDAIKKFRLGYAIDNGQDLYNKALKAGYDVKTLEDVGLCGRSQQGKYYDRFRGRVIYPVLNSAGKVVAFGGRGIKGESAKYINSPESAIYRKSNELYGIYQAKSAIISKDKCFLVEGYMDVIGMWQSGMENTVASSGTSLTDGQISLIHRFTNNVTLIYDGDSAGIKASMRGIDLLLTHNLNIKVLLLPDGEDPDSFSRLHTPDEFREYIEQNETDFIKFKTRVLLEGCGDDPGKRAESIKSIVRSLASISDMIKRSLYIQECSRLLNISENILIIEVKKVRGEVVQEEQKRRERTRLGLDESEISKTSATTESETRLAEPGVRVEEGSHNSILYPLERTIIRYCIRYGMVNYADATDSQGNVIQQNVAEVVKGDMSLDKIEFSTPIYRKIFQRIIDLIPEYNISKEEYLNTLSDEFKIKHESGLNEIANRQLSMQEIMAEEEKLANRLRLEKEQMLNDFAKLYIGKVLGSDPDDEVRHEVLSHITDKYQLSKYHSKMARVESEAEKLGELLPRAICELRDGAMQVELQNLKAQLNTANAESDNERVAALMEQIQQAMAIRRDFAKYMGERTISPKR